MIDLKLIKKRDAYLNEDGDRVKVLFTPSSPSPNIVHHHHKCNRSFLDRLFSIPTALQPPDRSVRPILNLTKVDNNLI